MSGNKIALKSNIKIDDHFGEIKPEDCKYLSDLGFIDNLSNTIFDFSIKNDKKTFKDFQNNHEIQFTIDQRELVLDMSNLKINDISIYQDPFKRDSNRFSLEVIYRTENNSFFHFRISHAWALFLYEVYKSTGSIQPSEYAEQQTLLSVQSQGKN